MFVGRFQLLIASAVAVFIFLLISLAFGATPVPDEVEVLKEIAKTLGKTDWDFNALCNLDANWTKRNNLPDLDVVTCNCSDKSNTTCHVISIALKSQNLSGTLPPELVRLPFLQEFDVTRNYLSGNIPPIWGKTQLEHISLIGNRINGTLPKEIGNISTLANLNLDFNQLSGAIPPELGNLSRLEKLTLTSNYWTGELPDTLANWTNLKTFRIGDSNLVGSIPNSIQNWESLQELRIQGSGLSGPIPPGIVFLTNLTDLRITGLNGNDSNFPNVSQAKNLEKLILRSCNIVGRLPDYLASMTNLRTLDLSFNKLNEQIPNSYSALNQTTYIYLTGNNFTGSVPSWMLSTKRNVDISYNNFNAENSTASICQEGKLNLFESSSKKNAQGAVSCSPSCSQKWSSFHINCGGGRQQIGDTIYEDDTESGGPSKLSFATNWLRSSTGHFVDGEVKDTYTMDTSISRINGTDSQLYVNARLSPLSLTYYGPCLLNGKFTVKLHFAEIAFTNDGTYASLDSEGQPMLI